MPATVHPWSFCDFDGQHHQVTNDLLMRYAYASRRSSVVCRGEQPDVATSISREYGNFVDDPIRKIFPDAMFTLTPSHLILIAENQSCALPSN